MANSTGLRSGFTSILANRIASALTRIASLASILAALANCFACILTQIAGLTGVASLAADLTSSLASCFTSGLTSVTGLTTDLAGALASCFTSGLTSVTGLATYLTSTLTACFAACLAFRFTCSLTTYLAPGLAVVADITGLTAGLAGALTSIAGLAA